MAVIDNKFKASSLKALTATAITLPGLLSTAVYSAEGDEVDFQYSHYQEGKREIYGDIFSQSTQSFTRGKLPNNFNPIEVDSLHGSARVNLTDRIKFSFNYTQDTWSGATPVSSGPVSLRGNKPRFFVPNKDYQKSILVSASPYVGDLEGFRLDRHFTPYKDSGKSDGNGSPIYVPAPGLNDQIVHTLALASPETRKQGDFKLSYEWDEAALDIGGGISVENDYESRFANLGGRMDFNNKQTTVNVGLSYTNSDTSATLDPDSLQFINTLPYDTSEYAYGAGIQSRQSNIPYAQIDSSYTSKGITIDGFEDFQRSSAVLHGNRQDWGTELGLTQVLNKDAVLNLDMGYTRSTGYLGNPYKLVTIINATAYPSQLASDGSDPIYGLISAGAFSNIEVRPGERNQFNWHFGYNHYIEPFDAALHFNYRFAHDDWGIIAHTFDADWVQPFGQGWTITPRIRYYSQTSADFYAPYFSTFTVIDPNTGLLITSKFNKELPSYYSSDQRLSGFGALSGGVTIAKQFTKGIHLEAGFEYYTHQGALKLGGGGEQAFADYNFWVANAALKINLEVIAPSASSSHDTHVDHSHHRHSAAPAGVMFDHTLEQSGDFMLGYRYMRSEQSGDMLFGDQPASFPTVNLQGCGDSECHVAPNYMAMNMHMLDMMYAPTDWLTLMLMPQWMDMEMDMTPLVTNSGNAHNHGGAAHSHQTGGIGDTGMYALFKLFDKPNHHINLSLGVTAPTGDVAVTLRKTATNSIPNIPIHYGMQLGSGTWDFKPSLTYTGEHNAFSWGVQATGTLRLESRNQSGFAFGDIFQGSVWGGYQWTNWLATTVRGVYTWQDSISGQYPQMYSHQNGEPYISKHVGPFDKPANYGGQFVDLGLGINVTVPSGVFEGNSIKFEWLQPVHTDYNGYQLDRDGALSATWNMMF